MDKLKKFTNILKNSGSTPVYVLFYSDHCGACKYFKPIVLDHFKKCEQLGINIISIFVSADSGEELFNYYNIEGIPTLMLFIDNKLVETIIGSNKEKLLDSLKKYTKYIN